MVLIHNERVKLRAQAINTAATSCFAAGVLAPLAAAFYNLTADRIPLHTVVVGIIVYLSAAMWLHKKAIEVLGGLTE